MGFRRGMERVGWWGRNSAVANRPAGRVIPGVEVLESRLLMAGSPVPVAALSPRLDSLPPVEQAPSSVPAKDDGAATPVKDDDADAPAPGPYVVMAETAAFHGTFATAQAIPMVPYVGVEGKAWPGNGMGLYRVEMGPDPIDFRLAPAHVPFKPMLPLRLSLFDANGHLIGLATSTGGVVDMAESPGTAGLAPGSEVYVGVDSPDASSAAAAVGYQLWFLRLPGTTVSAADLGQRGEGPADSTFATVPLGTSGTPGPRVGLPARQINVSPSGPAPAGSSQLPTLAAAPAGGLLADGTPTRTVAVATQNPDEPPWLEGLAGANDSAWSDERAGDGWQDTKEGPGLVALRGPGGLPVFAAATAGDWHNAHREATPAAGTEAPAAIVRLAAPEPCIASMPPILPVPCAATAVVPEGPAAGQPEGTITAALSVYAVSVLNTSFHDVLGDERKARGRRRRVVAIRTP